MLVGMDGKFGSKSRRLVGWGFHGGGHAKRGVAGDETVLTKKVEDALVRNVVGAYDFWSAEIL